MSPGKTLSTPRCGMNNCAPSSEMSGFDPGRTKISLMPAPFDAVACESVSAVPAPGATVTNVPGVTPSPSAKSPTRIDATAAPETLASAEMAVVPLVVPVTSAAVGPAPPPP